MEIKEIRVLAGPSIYSYHPVLHITVQLGRYAEQSSDALPGFTARLLRALPGLRQHCCSRGYAGGFVERLREGTYLAHIYEHVILELQALAGYDVHYGKARATAVPGEYYVVVGFVSAAAAVAAARQGAALLTAVLAGEEAATAAAVAAIEQAAAAHDLGPSTAAIAAAARKRGIPVNRIGDTSILILGYGRKQRRVQATTTDRTSCLGADIAGDKALTKEVLAANGIPVPPGEVVDSAAAAVEAAARLGGPVVVKPLDGNQGKGVSVGLTAAAAIRRAFDQACQYSARVVVERYIPGRQYRVCIVGGRMAAAAERVPPCVQGDGRHTVAELVALLNRDPRRGEDHEKPLTKVKVDTAVVTTLARQGLTLAQVPAAGQTVWLRDSCNLSTGGTARDVTDIIHPDNVFLAVRAARAVGLDVAGVDIVTADIRAPITGNGGAVIEVNAAPGIRMHHYPEQGQPRDVGQAIVDMLFAPGENGRVPVIAVTGTNGKTTTTRMIGHIWRLTGCRVGMTTTDGIFVNERCILRGDNTGPVSARMVLLDPTVDVAVLETARGGIIRGGLAYQYSDVGIITNITEDHLGQDGIEDLHDLAYVKSLVAETVHRRGHVVLNADDPYVLQIAPRVRANIIYVSLAADNITVKRHLGVGGQAVFLRQDVICVAAGHKCQEIVPVRDIPVTLNGIARHNVQNALFAVAACYSQGLPAAFIREGLCSFARNPGRLNLLQVENFRVIVDYGHNPAGYEVVINTARQLRARRLVGVIAAPGDRRDDVIRNIGRIAGQGFERIIIKEDADLRGRRPGETAALLLEGVLEAGRPREQVQLVLPEGEAVATALRQAVADDLVVIFYEQYDTVMAALEDFRRRREPRGATPEPVGAVAGMTVV